MKYKLSATFVLVLVVLMAACSQVNETVEVVDVEDSVDVGFSAEELTPRPLEELQATTDFVVEVEPGLFVDGNAVLAYQDHVEEHGELSAQFDTDLELGHLRIRSNILDQFDDVIKIELNFVGESGKRISVPDAEYLKWKKWTEDAVKEWLAPVAKYRRLPKIIVDTGLRGEDLDINVRYYSGRCVYHVPGMRGRTDYRIQMFQSCHNYDTLLHEMGHAMGLYDTYSKSEEHKLLGPCTPGNPSAVMCQHDPIGSWNRSNIHDLSADDIRGVRNRFCRINSSYCDETQLNHTYGDSGGVEAVEYCGKGDKESYVNFYNHELEKNVNWRDDNYLVENLVGVQVSWGRSQIDTIQAICSFTTSDNNQLANYETVTPNKTRYGYGGTPRNIDTFWCNTGTYVKELRFDRYSTDPRSLQIVCSDGKRSRTYGEQLSLRYSYACPTEYPAAKGFTVSSNSDIDALGLVCGVPDGSLFRTYNNIR